MDEFRLTITLGNDAMQSNEDVAAAMEKAADSVRRFGFGFLKAVRDENGNTVGTFGVYALEDCE